ncbi:4-hydroxythreonine-4-phosphate dehydrogenase PdxA [uncultured Ilyobacter sp.]|uniref:4-hydroxythreonine-4-phosphate dehydrogenase PdxA n=1 Tax=uncultured Ilyobacter sp. TaxID=544433 RepID=UPI002AA5E587|nr:4-hydroxythreonine-4-phosphate dehydrogenase PdxA [uncultured Ilyobacter sp.]
MNKIIGITMGDPSGIGPEIILKSFLNKKIKSGKYLVIGDYEIIDFFNKKLGLNVKLEKLINIDNINFSKDVLSILDLGLIKMENLKIGEVSLNSGNAAFQYLKKAIELAMNGKISGIATAPLNKEAMNKAGHFYSGHTEILGYYTSTKDYAMLLYDEKLSTIHVSTHVSLKEAIKRTKKERVEEVIRLADKTFRKLGLKNPKIAVAGLNPHSGENGLFGMEEIEEIIPAINSSISKGINVEGPIPPDTVFLKAVEGNYDVVVAMYHDQGHIPLKLLGFNSGVNVTVGLPIIRTSVDHGTAFEIAGENIANEESMINAINLVHKLSDA